MFRLVSGAIDKVRLESFDRQLGAMFGFAKGVLLCVAITFFAVTLLPPAQGEAIVASQSGRYIVALLDKSHSVFPPEIHQMIDPYLNKIEERLNPNFQPHGHDVQDLWPSQAQLQTQESQPAGCRRSIGRRRSKRPPGPRQTQTSDGATVESLCDSAGAAIAFPDPYSAELPTNRGY